MIVGSDLHEADQVAAIPLANVDGQPVYVRDVATVELGITEDYIRASSQNGAAVLIGVSRQPGGNTEKISAAAHAIVNDFQAAVPDVAFLLFLRSGGAGHANRSTACVTLSCWGSLLAVAVVYGFTRCLDERDWSLRWSYRAPSRSPSPQWRRSA